MLRRALFLICTFGFAVAFSRDDSSPKLPHGFPPELADRLTRESAAADLGASLFHAPVLSIDETIACVNCHDPGRNFTRNETRSKGVRGQETKRNVPTIVNRALGSRFSWDGRAATLEEQVDGPLLHPEEMASSWPAVLEMLGGDAAYAKTFRDVYPDGITQANVKDALATFERSLVTPNSRFDRWLRGETDALNSDEQQGFHLFVDTGCVTCHQGVNVGGNLFEVLGRSADYFKDRGNEKPADLGRFNVTGNEADKHKFKVPTLRNVELTAPYLHDGSAPTLEDAVEVMAKYQVGRELQPHEVKLLVAFLKTLTGENAIRP
jgi:cytochrome c peroxidase